MKTFLLFLDECISPVTRIVSLTGMLINVKNAVEIRNNFISLMIAYSIDKDGIKGYNLPEIHGSDFLNNTRVAINEKQKIHILKEIITLLGKHKVELYRAGYYLNRPIRNIMCYKKRDKDILTACWDGIIRGIQGRLRTSYVIPVMDFCDDDQMRIMSQQLYSTHLLRHEIGENRISIRHTDNMVGEVFYAKSEFSICTQLVDLASYLCHLQDLERYKMPLNSFQTKMLANSSIFPGLIMINNVIVMREGNRPMGPIKIDYKYISKKLKKRSI